MWLGVYENAKVNFDKDISLLLINLFMEKVDILGMKQNAQNIKEAQLGIFEYMIDETNEFLSDFHRKSAN